MTKDEMKNRISMALKDPILEQGFEIICKNLAELEKENAEFRAKIYGGGYDAVIAKKDADIILLEKQNSEQKKQIEEMKCCYNCANDTLEPPEVIGNGICVHCKNHDKWELAE